MGEYFVVNSFTHETLNLDFQSDNLIETSFQEEEKRI